MYSHKVNYYETDKMGITHHSNYIRWMEEARIDFLDSHGFSYSKLESDGIISPVVNVNCHYIKPTTFNDTIDIEVNIAEFSGIKLRLSYKMFLRGTLVCEAESLHCFVNLEGKPIRVQKQFPNFAQMLENATTE